MHLWPVEPFFPHFFSKSALISTDVEKIEEKRVQLVRGSFVKKWLLIKSIHTLMPKQNKKKIFFPRPPIIGDKPKLDPDPGRSNPKDVENLVLQFTCHLLFWLLKKKPRSTKILGNSEQKVSKHTYFDDFFFTWSSRLVKIFKFHEFRFDLGQTLRQLLNLGS